MGKVIYVLAQPVSTSGTACRVHGVTESDREYDTWLSAGGVGFKLEPTDVAAREAYEFEYVDPFTAGDGKVDE